jgi:hypothetical protein
MSSWAFFVSWRRKLLYILPDITEATGVFDQTLDASLFYIEPEWMKDVKDLFRTRQIEATLSVQQK